MKIYVLDQPLLVSLSKARERRAGKAEYVYLVPELCCLTGVTEEMRSDFSLMTDVVEHTRTDPPAWLKSLENFNQRLQKETAVSCVVVGC